MQTDPATVRFITALVWAPTAFGLYYLLIKGDLLAREDIPAGTRKSVSRVLRHRLLGLLLFGVIPVLILRIIFREFPADYGTGFTFHRPPPWWIYLVLLLIPVAVHRTASEDWNLAVYPQIRIRIWTPGILLVSCISWILYLVAYEFLLRGFLLSTSVAVMPVWLAIALNCTLYALVHLYKGTRETLGAIPAGILFCLLTLRTGNIWWAVLIHSMMALSNEWFSIRAHPEMNFRRKGTTGSPHRRQRGTDG